mgnify:CR=1 FL=1
MFKRFLPIVVFISLAGLLVSVDLGAYELESGSVGNKYTLQIENLGTQSLSGVAVTLINSPAWLLNFSPTFIDIGDIAPNAAEPVAFRFDIAPGSDSSDGMIELQITTLSGKVWKKNLILYVVPRLVDFNPQTNGSCCNISQYDLYTPGDANGDERISLSDIIYLVNYVFKAGPEPLPFFLSGDMNGDGQVTLNDVIALVNYIFRSP